MDNIEDYYYSTVRDMYSDYIKYTKEMDHSDPEFPGSVIEFKSK